MAPYPSIVHSMSPLYSLSNIDIVYMSACEDVARVVPVVTHAGQGDPECEDEGPELDIRLHHFQEDPDAVHQFSVGLFYMVNSHLKIKQ